MTEQAGGHQQEAQKQSELWSQICDALIGNPELVDLATSLMQDKALKILKALCDEKLPIQFWARGASALAYGQIDRIDKAAKDHVDVYVKVANGVFLSLKLNDFIFSVVPKEYIKRAQTCVAPPDHHS